MLNKEYLRIAPYFSRHRHNLAVRIISISHSACDAGDLDTASKLLHVVDLIISLDKYPASLKRKIEHSIVMTHERLWLLRFPKD